MQDRYAGDVGDFGKLALLRALQPGRRLGVCWYRTDGTRETNHDGKHTLYLEQPERFRHLDPELFDALRHLAADVTLGRRARSVASLQKLGVLHASTRYHDMLCPEDRRQRETWATAMLDAVRDRDLVFLDPDNGLEGKKLKNKSAAIAELRALRAPARALLLYHHTTRFKGGAAAEVPDLMRRLRDAGFRSVEAIRIHAYSSRYFLLLDGDVKLIARLDALAERWSAEATRFRAPDYVDGSGST